jgi:hypothetical protein
MVTEVCSGYFRSLRPLCRSCHSREHLCVGPAGAGSPDIPDNPAWDAISIAAEATWT